MISSFNYRESLYRNKWRFQMPCTDQCIMVSSSISPFLYRIMLATLTDNRKTAIFAVKTANMAALNISFEIPQTSTFSVDEFRREMMRYADKLIVKLSAQSTKSYSSKAHVFSYNELSPELKRILEMAAPLKGTVAEEDLDGDLARTEALQDHSL